MQVQYRNWYHMRELDRTAEEEDPMLLLDADSWVKLTDHPSDQRLREWMRMSPHACDHSYHQLPGFGLCRGKEVPGTVSRTGASATPYPVLSTTKNGTTRMCDLRVLPEVTGFLDPYRNYVDGMDTLWMVEQTIRRC